MLKFLLKRELLTESEQRERERQNKREAFADLDKFLRMTLWSQLFSLFPWDIWDSAREAIMRRRREEKKRPFCGSYSPFLGHTADVLRYKTAPRKLMALLTWNGQGNIMICEIMKRTVKNTLSIHSKVAINASHDNGRKLLHIWLQKSICQKQ